jgi:hypothetical protein
MAAPRILVPGVDITKSADLLLEQGAVRLDQWRTGVQAWMTAGHVVVDGEITEDRRRMQLNLRVKTEPPVAAWALGLREALNALRAAFDALAWDLAHIDKAHVDPGDEPRIYFPIALTAKDWRNASKVLAKTVPAEILLRIKSVQPLNGRPDGLMDLYVLHDLDIQGKHRGLLSAQASVGHQSAEFELRLRDDTEARLLKRKGPLPIETGTIVGNIIFSKAVLPGADDGFRSRNTLELLVNLRDGKTIDAMTLAAGLPHALRLYIQYIYTGKDNPSLYAAFKAALPTPRPDNVSFTKLDK